MDSLFCCGNIQPFRPQYLSHQDKFNAFMAWAAFPKTSIVSDRGTNPASLTAPYVVQLVRQINYGALESVRYFAAVEGKTDSLLMSRATWSKLISKSSTGKSAFRVPSLHSAPRAAVLMLVNGNSYKNYKCQTHDKFFEVNIYQKDPVNQHHWRANVARPAGSIDL